MKRELLRKGPVIASINADDTEAFYYSPHSKIGDDDETPSSIKDTEKTTVSFSFYDKGIMQQDLVKEPKIAIAQTEDEEKITIPEEGSILVQIDAKQVINQDHDHSVLVIGWGTDVKT